MKPKKILVASATLVVLVFVLWHGTRIIWPATSTEGRGVVEPDTLSAPSANAAQSSKPGEIDDGGSGESPLDAAQTSATGNVLDEDPVAVALRSTTASGALDALLPAMQQGDARAMLMHRRLIGRCSEYRDGERFWPSPSAEEGSESWLAQRQAIAEEGRYCGTDARLQDPLLRGARSVTQRLNELARRSDPEAMAFVLGTDALQQPGVSEEQLALDLLKSDLSPDARQMLLQSLVGGQIESRYSEFGSDVFARMQVPTERQQLIKQLAVVVYGCEIGANCRAFGATQNQFCIAYASCAPHLTLDQFILTRYVAPQEAQVIRHLVGALRQFPPRG